MTIWFTSDTHFGHSNIIQYSNRPFASVQSMDEVLINNWNQLVRPQDIIYHLGDFTLRGHSHGQLPPLKNSLDVGVDCWKYQPLPVDTIFQALTISQKDL
jgi:calcineurin-like phosphoesterase family protein